MNLEDKAPEAIPEQIYAIKGKDIVSPVVHDNGVLGLIFKSPTGDDVTVYVGDTIIDDGMISDIDIHTLFLMWGKRYGQIEENNGNSIKVIRRNLSLGYNGIPIKGGVNNCEWNNCGICSNPMISRGEPGYQGRDMKSRVGCTLTILGCHLCNGYSPFQ